MSARYLSVNRGLFAALAWLTVALTFVIEPAFAYSKYFSVLPEGAKPPIDFN